MRRLAFAFAAVVIAGVAPAIAQVPLDGFVIARKACDATPSIRNAANEGGTVLAVGQAYRLLGENRANGTHYYVELPDAQPSRRWIEKSCGDWVRLVAAAEAFDRPAGGGGTDAGDAGGAVDQDAAADPSGTPGAGTGASGGQHRDLLLAVSWQPAFCETHASKAECRSQTDTRFDATHFTLHGLWPQPNGTFYCGVSDADRSADDRSDWESLPATAVDAETRQALDEVMPGSQSDLDRHEWTKHGSCYGTSADEYFDDALALMTKLNASPVQALFAGAIGRPLSDSDIRAAFDQAFGAGAGARVQISCVRDGNRRLVGELLINLQGEVTANPDLAALLAAAPEARPSRDCDGFVDAVGLQ
ncbi:ribonuclease T2 [Mangrovibrevibacter kandeliae]|uniref:ribonuclease T2 n=1 Tax=Mangrovibrevibacter kandeliae TaxID=2968473 RepID=UPI0021173D75|nr:ribonuclease T2 [Aurantimonas sp. CSK15Z-1]